LLIHVLITVNDNDFPYRPVYTASLTTGQSVGHIGIRGSDRTDLASFYLRPLLLFLSHGSFLFRLLTAPSRSRRKALVSKKHHITLEPCIIMVLTLPTKRMRRLCNERWMGTPFLEGDCAMIQRQIIVPDHRRRQTLDGAGA
jgi:hypothetical protein